MLITGMNGPTGRRGLLRGAVAGAALLAAGCQSAEQGETAAGASAPSRAERLRGQAYGDAAALLKRYDDALAAHPSLAAAVAPLRAEAAAHAAALRGAGKADGKGSRSPSGMPSSGAPSASAPLSAVAADPVEARGELALAAKQTAQAYERTLARAPGELARLLASVSAAATVHAYLLSKGAAE
ncbi:hypothetical protein ACFQLX_09010 [Streptomyces polyrhachis]|uniref:Lipoprotein n=1 Tax=Streptomyces polyrhachis TaxID=1282885 RepID=A0ABW2GBY9_9ACTN